MTEDTTNLHLNAAYLAAHAQAQAALNPGLPGDSNNALLLAAQNAHLNVINGLLELTTNEQQRNDMVHADNDYAFRLAAENGHIVIISPGDQVSNANETVLDTEERNQDQTETVEDIIEKEKSHTARVLASFGSMTDRTNYKGHCF